MIFGCVLGLFHEGVIGVVVGTVSATDLGPTISHHWKVGSEKSYPTLPKWVTVGTQMGGLHDERRSNQTQSLTRH